MRKLILPLILISMVTGCAQQRVYSPAISHMAHTASESEIQSMMGSSIADLNSKGEITYSNIYAIRNVSANGHLSRQVCALARGSDWDPGEYKQVHFQRDASTITNSNVLTGSCDITRYPLSSGFTFKSGRQSEIANADMAVDASNPTSDDASSTDRVRVEITRQQEDFAKNVISEMLKDPESARFRSMYGAKGNVEKIAICGEFNAKNSYGGYTGYKPFMVFEGDSDRGFVWDSNADGYSFDNMMIEMICPTE